MTKTHCVRSPLVAGVNYATPWEVGQYLSAMVNNFNNQFVSALLGHIKADDAEGRE